MDKGIFGQNLIIPQTQILTLTNQVIRFHLDTSSVVDDSSSNENTDTNNSENWWTQFTNWIKDYLDKTTTNLEVFMNTTVLTELINQYGYLAIALLIALENIFSPIPSEVILTFAGF